MKFATFHDLPRRIVSDWMDPLQSMGLNVECEIDEKLVDIKSADTGKGYLFYVSLDSYRAEGYVNTELDSNE